MKFLLHEEAGKPHIVLKGEAFKYLVKVRRHQVGERVRLRHPEHMQTLCSYRMVSIDGRQAELALESSEPKEIGAARGLHIGWCRIDPKSVEKILPQLNEIGVQQITFIGCARSQKQHHMDLARLERILDNSVQQCGRSQKMVLGSADSLENFLADNPGTVVLDFCETVLSDALGIDTVLIGCEGGFSDEEREMLAHFRTVRFDTPMILRSETAAVAAAVKILL